MKKHTRTLLMFVLFALACTGCSAGQGGQKQDAKTAIADHMNSVHGLSINSYQSLFEHEDGSASATVAVTVALEGFGSMEMAPEIYLSKDRAIDSCTLCDLGVGYNGGAAESVQIEKTSTIYQAYILRKAEEMTGFVISLENQNYQEYEITENGRTYITVSAIITIEKILDQEFNLASAYFLDAIINPDNEEDLFLLIWANSVGELYRYDHSSIPRETAEQDSDASEAMDMDDEEYAGEIPINALSEPPRDAPNADPAGGAASEPEEWRTRFDGLAAISGGWVYYRGTGGLCRMKTDGSDRQLMSEDIFSVIEIHGDWVYYENMKGLYRIKTDGSNRQEIYNGYIDFFTVEQGWIYCLATQGGFEIFRMRPDGSDRQNILTSQELWDSFHYTAITVKGDWVYFGSLYRIQTDGTNLQELSSTAFFHGSKTVIGDWLYSMYLNSAIYENDRSNYGIIRTKIDGSEEEILIDHEAWSCAVREDWIYYSNPDDGSRLYRMKPDGSENQLFLDANASYFRVDGDWVYYWDFDLTGQKYSDLFRIKTDGSQKQLIGRSAAP